MPRAVECSGSDHSVRSVHVWGNRLGGEVEALLTPSLKVLGSYGLILVVAMLVYMRYAVHVSGRRLAVWSILAFALLVSVLMAAHPFAEGAK